MSYSHGPCAPVGTLSVQTVSVNGQNVVGKTFCPACSRKSASAGLHCHVNYLFMLKYFQPTKLIFQRRQLSTAASVIHDWKSRLTSHVDESHDNLAGSQFNLLANTLNDPLTEYKHDIIPPDGTPLPPAWHLVYFPPRFTENELASDGYELNFKPPNPFVHRMWAGARLEWDRKNPLRIGQTATMKSKLADVQVNEGRRGESAFVWIDKDIHNEHGYSMRESRCLVYVQEPTDGGDRATPAKRIKGKTHCYVFRFSFATS